MISFTSLKLLANHSLIDLSESSSFKKSNSAKYEINAHAGQIPLPVGVTTIIETFSQSIVPIQLKAGDEAKRATD